MVGQRQTTQIKRIYPHITRPLRTPILDIGSGTGLLKKELELSVIAIDISQEMLRLNNGIRCIADWAELPFSNAAFGTVFDQCLRDRNRSFDPPKTLRDGQGHERWWSILYHRA